MPRPIRDYSKTIPQGLFAAFQMMFAVITPALITGAFVERVRFKSFLLFSLLWATLVYDPLCHWVWGQGGWLKNLGVLDFAGGTVVHIAAGFSALAFALVIGPRKGFGKSPMEPNNIPLTVLGAGLLWVGWFGFNAGSCPGRQRRGRECPSDDQHLCGNGRACLDGPLLARRPAKHPGNRHGDGRRLWRP